MVCVFTLGIVTWLPPLSFTFSIIIEIEILDESGSVETNHPFSVPSVSSWDDFISAVPDLPATLCPGTAPSGTSALFTINAGITKVRIYAWVEGQDVDCENDASGTNVTFNIKFTKVA